MAANGNSRHSVQYQMLLESGLDESVASTLDSLFIEGILTPEELDERAIGALKELEVESALAVITDMKSSDLQSVTNKSAYMCGLMKTWRQKMAAGMTDSATSKPGPSSEKMHEILQRTRYSHEVTIGQRKYGGPPPNWGGPQPGPGYEIYCGRIPQTIFEDTLIPMFEKCGTIWDLRLMMDPVTGLNKSFCFVTFTTKEAAQNAVKQLDGYELKPGKKLKINISVANVRLFVGNIPKNKSKEELKAEFSKHVDGLNDVIIYTNPDNPNKRNRGFAFLEFDSHKSAANARRRLSSTPIFGVDIVINWAEPQEEPDEEVMSKVKILYVRNLKSDITESQVKEKFEQYGPIERVKKFKDYCFVHFVEREHALRAMNELNKTLLNTSEMLITLAKPAATYKQQKQERQYGTAAWSQPVMPVVVRGRGRGLRPMARVSAYSIPAAVDPYGYESYEYEYDESEYGYEDADYYGAYGYATAAVEPVYPVVAVRRPARARALRGRVLPVRGARVAAPVPVAVPVAVPVRRGVRGLRVRGVVPPPRGLAMARGALRLPRGHVIPVAATRGHLRGLKRKVPETWLAAPERKRVMQEDAWVAQPIVQQPLASEEDEWYQDSWE